MNHGEKIFTSFSTFLKIQWLYIMTNRSINGIKALVIKKLANALKKS